MKILIEGGRPYLAYKELRISLEPQDLKMFELMTPLGRKVYLRQKAKMVLRENPTDSEAALVLKLFTLPARNWTFSVPLSALEVDPP